jgi:hypothetical protein
MRLARISGKNPERTITQEYKILSWALRYTAQRHCSLGPSPPLRNLARFLYEGQCGFIH